MPRRETETTRTPRDSLTADACTAFRAQAERSRRARIDISMAIARAITPSPQGDASSEYHRVRFASFFRSWARGRAHGDKGGRQLRQNRMQATRFAAANYVRAGTGKDGRCVEDVKGHTFRKAKGQKDEEERQRNRMQERERERESVSTCVCT